MTNIKVLIVDDHELLREGVRSLFQQHSDIVVVGEASNGMEAIEKSSELNPDVVLMDISMPSMGGIEATRKIIAKHSEIKVIGLSRHDNLSYVRSLLEAGASGYVTKKTVSKDLVTAIRVAYAGEVFLEPYTAKEIARDYIQMIRYERKADPYERLTDREKEILGLIAEGQTSRQIAERLYLSVKTILSHKKNIMEKFCVENSTQLIKYIVQRGLADDDFDDESI